MRDLKRLMPHDAKICQNCKTKTIEGRYVPIDKYHQEWKCNTCATKAKKQ